MPYKWLTNCFLSRRKQESQRPNGWMLTTTIYETLHVIVVVCAAVVVAVVETNLAPKRPLVVAVIFCIRCCSPQGLQSVCHCSSVALNGSSYISIIKWRVYHAPLKNGRVAVQKEIENGSGTDLRAVVPPAALPEPCLVYSTYEKAEGGNNFWGKMSRTRGKKVTDGTISRVQASGDDSKAA